MLSRRGDEIKGTKNMTIISEGVQIDGKINCPGSLRIDGSAKGEIIVGKDIVIGKEGNVEATARTVNATIAGTYKGDMTSSGEVEITSTGKFIGNLIQKDALLTIARGGLFKGESTLSSDSNVFEPENEKKDIEVDTDKLKKD
jgi:cytoskeletal protein CcmA (bactofilin family)